MRPIKEELIYTEDPTSIGRWVELDDDEGGCQYEPVLRFNFMVLGYISSPYIVFGGIVPYKDVVSYKDKQLVTGTFRKRNQTNDIKWLIK